MNNNTANGGRQCVEYTKDGTPHFIRFNVVKNNRTRTLYTRIWDGDTFIFETRERSHNDKEASTRDAKQRLLSMGYTIQ